MKTLVVAFSRTGNNKLLAAHVSDTLKADMDEIACKKYGMFMTILREVFKMGGRIHYDKDPSKYERIIFCTPSWIGHLPGPVRQYISKENFSSYAVISFCGSGDNPQMKKDFEELLGPAIAYTQMKTAEKPGEVQITNLAPFKKEISAFLKALDK